jgi:hypothetical protein
MKEITVYKLSDNSANIDQLRMKRDWMDLTFDKHAYQCFPISLANRIGWEISFPEDISFIWDGVNDPTPEHVNIIKGSKYVHPDRGNRTISFNTKLYFESKSNLSLLTMPVPNQFIDGAQCMTTIVSTSVLQNEFPIAWMITRPNVEITIPANTPIASIVPISIKDIEKHQITIKPGMPEKWKTDSWRNLMRDRSEVSQARNGVADWTHFYRDAVDHLGNKFGEHESKKVILKVKNYEQD